MFLRWYMSTYVAKNNFSEVSQVDAGLRSLIVLKIRGKTPCSMEFCDFYRNSIPDSTEKNHNYRKPVVLKLKFKTIGNL